jgi:hypothetical protein
MNLYVENPKDSTNIELISKFSKVALYKINMQTAVFLDNNTGQSEKKTSPFTMAPKKNKILTCKLDKESKRRVH